MVSRREVVLLEVDCQDDPFSARVKRRLTVQDNPTRRKPAQRAVRQIAAHRGIDGLNARFDRQLARMLEVNFRQDQPECRRRSPDHTVEAFPIFRFTGKLIAGNHGPFGRVDAFFR